MIGLYILVMGSLLLIGVVLTLTVWVAVWVVFAVALLTGVIAVAHGQITTAIICAVVAYICGSIGKYNPLV